MRNDESYVVQNLSFAHSGLFSLEVNLVRTGPIVLQLVLIYDFNDFLGAQQLPETYCAHHEELVVLKNLVDSYLRLRSDPNLVGDQIAQGP